MSGHERFGFVRVLLAGVFVLVVVGAHLVVAVLEVLAAGFVAVAAWRWLGATVRRRLDSRPRRWW